MSRKLWIMLICGALVVLLANGMRLTFGIFLKPISMDLGISREAFGLVIAGQTLLYGVLQPIVGIVADRYGSIKTIVIGAAVYAAGLWLTSLAADLFHLHLTFGLMVALGLAAAANAIVLGAVGKVVPAERRGVVFGTVIAAGSLGMFILVPVLQELLGAIGWRQTMWVMAGLIGLVVVLAFGLRAPESDGASAARQPFGDAVSEARRHRGYVLLTFGFFVCGFHVTFISTHLPAYFADNGVSLTAASYAFGVIGLCNIVGAYLFGALGDRWRKKSVLTVIYSLRGVLMAAMLVLPMNDVTAIVFGACMGMVWLATVPLTSGIVAQIFGPQHFSFLFGIVFMSHQIGGFCGAWLGGRIYDMTGTYDLMWGLALVLALASAALHWPINDHPLARLAPARS